MIAIILAKDCSLFNFAKEFKNEVVFFILIIFFLSLLVANEDATQQAPFFNAFLINLLPSLFLPLIAKNKLFFFTNLESIESPRKFRFIFFPNIFDKIDLF